MIGQGFFVARNVADVARTLRLSLLLGLAGVCAGCTTDGGPMTMAQSGPAVTFESIDGPPPPVFERMVRMMEAESQARSISVVSRDAPASYRVRSYLSAQVRRGRTMIAWVWDVYDRDQNRAVRLSGEESAGKPGRDAWAQADEALLRRIARDGMAGIAALVNGSAPDARPSRPEPTLRGPVVAEADSPTPATPGRVAAFSAVSTNTR